MDNAKKQKSRKSKPKSVKKNTGGRPTKLTDQVIEDFSTAVSIGSTYTLAAMYAKVSVEVISLWLRLGRKEFEDREKGVTPNKKNYGYLKFLMAVREAETEAGISWQKVVNTAAKADPTWALKMLRLRFGAGYVETDLTANLEIPADMPIEYYDRIIRGEDPYAVVQDYRINVGADKGAGVKAETSPAD